MFKPMECPRCKSEPRIWHYQDIDSGADRFTIQHRCNKNVAWIEIYTKTAFGATLRWNAYCRRELRRMRKE